MNGALEALIAGGYGLASALVPVVNAEAFAVLAGTRGDHLAFAILGLAIGQTTGKLLLFESARRASGPLARWHARRLGRGQELRQARRLGRRPRSQRAAARLERAAARAARWAQPIRRWLSRRRSALPTVLVSAVTGIPPLAAVSLAAGTGDLRRWEFAAPCLLGRCLRFALLALPVALAVHGH